MAKKLIGRFRHVNKGQIIEDGREIEFRIEMKSGDIVVVQMELAQIKQFTAYVENLGFKASED
jgi:hypothetical protein